MDKKIEYNKTKADKYGWDPTWFGAKQFDDDLINAIASWQKKNGLTPDGMCGPGTYRRLLTEREQNIDDYEPDLIPDKEESFIVYQGNFIPINWPKVVLWSEDKGLKLEKGFSPYTEKRDIKMFMNHWDVCLNSKTCNRVLQKRGISVHFLLDNDGTIYQTMDMNHAAWHAGSKSLNHSTVGIEISNAYDLKWQSWYKKNGFGERPVIEGETVHGNKMKPFTGFYDVQIQALKALWKAIHEGLGVPLECPVDDKGNTLKEVSKDVESNKFRGFVSHYHATSRKIDCAGLDIKKLLQDIK